MNIGSRIQQRLNELGWQRKDLLSRIPDLTPQALSNLINRDSVRSEWDEAIAGALGVSVLWLVYNRSEEKNEFRLSKDEVAIISGFRLADETGKATMRFIAERALKSKKPTPSATDIASMDISGLLTTGQISTKETNE